MNHRTTLRKLWEILRPLRGVIFLSALLRTINLSLGILLISLAVWGIMQAVTTDTQPVRGVLLALIFLGMVKGLCRYLEQFSGHYVAFRLLSDLRQRLYNRLEIVAPTGLEGARSGDLVSRAISDVERIEVFYAHTIAPTVVAITVPALTLMALAWFSPLMATVTAGFLVLAGGLVPWAGHRYGTHAAAQVRKILAEMNAHFTDSIQGLREVLIHGYGERRKSELRGQGRELIRAQARLVDCGAGQSMATEVLIGGATLAALGIGLHEVAAGSLSAADFAVSLSLVMGAFIPILGISTLIPDFEQAIRSAGRLFEIMEGEDEPAPLRTTAPRLRDTGIVFRNVSFTYPGASEPQLRNLDITIPAGKVTALAGRSGAGKSTLVSLLLRFREIGSGSLHIGGVPASELSPEAQRDLIAVVPQRPYFFNISLRENLRLAKPDATQQEIETAAKHAQIHDFILSLPDGYDTIAQETGTRLSGGQRQRLAIAQAFLKDTPILILDEATSGLDTVNNRAILRALAEWKATPSRHGPRTLLIIAHRLSFVRTADHIYVLEDGRVCETGTHESLKEAGSVYGDLFGISKLSPANLVEES